MSSKEYYDRRNGAQTPLQYLSPGDQILLKSDQSSKWSAPGTVVATDRSNRTYLVNTPSGVFRRNRQQLLKTPTSDPSNGQEDSKNISEPNIQNSNVIESPPSSRPNTRSTRGYIARKPVRFPEEE